ncbi:MAG: mono/diheme cytochrome c family protein [Halioglobus sp.]|jgi:mono/diheme cytochrome c family protein
MKFETFFRPVTTSLVAFIWLTLVLACTAAEIVAPKDEPRTAWDGVYTQKQAERGQNLVDQHCSMCHGKNLFGSRAAPAIAGTEMLFVWDGRKLTELLEIMRTTMPPGQVGTINNQEFVDIIATILQASAYPANDKTDLSLQQLEKIAFRREKPE